MQNEMRNGSNIVSIRHASSTTGPKIQTDVVDGGDIHARGIGDCWVLKKQVRTKDRKIIRSAQTESICRYSQVNGTGRTQTRCGGSRIAFGCS